MPDIARAKEMLVPADNVFAGAWGHTRKWLVLHKTGGGSSARNVAGWFQSGAGGARTSTHYIVGLDGEIVQCVRERDGAGGNGVPEPGADAFWPRDVNLNLVTFSIESVDPSPDNATPMPHAQKQALFWLARDLCRRQHIPMRPADRHGGIAGHNSIAPQTRSRCPGRLFPWSELWEYLAEGEEMDMLELSDPMGRYFTDLGNGRWHCRNGIDLIGEQLTFYRRHMGVFGLPLTNEIYLERYPNTALVIYEGAIAIYDPAGVLERLPPRHQSGCYLIHLDAGLGQEILSRPVVSALEQEIARLQSQLNEQDAEVLAAMKQGFKQIQSIATQFSNS